MIRSLLPLLALLLPACASKDDTGGGGGDFSDGDGDGYATSVDCNDGDATVNPGADEVWYDGVDQDCDGADDDQDGDGFALAQDCDDTDPTAYPGAGEVLDDGVDQDCDGSDAFSGSTPDDVDNDGYSPDEDCDDQDPDAYPGAPEVADDGVDQDCDGEDLVSVEAISPGDLLVTEIMRKPGVVGDSYGEWIEVHNATDAPLLLDGLVVASDAQAINFTVEGGVIVDAGGYAILAREGNELINGGVTVDYDYRTDFALDNDADTITVSSRGAGVLDVVAYDDATFYPDTTGASMSLDAGHLDRTSNDNGQLWCDGASTFGSGDFGTPGAANGSCPGLGDSDGDGYVAAHDCNDSNGGIHPGAAETARDGTDTDCDGADYAGDALRDGELIITEIMQNPDIVSDADGEWFEVYNNTTSTLNLRGLGVGDSLLVSFVVDADVIVASHTYAVFAVDSDPTHNGGVATVAYDYPGSAFSLANSNDEIYLYAGADIRATRVDRVVYDGGKRFPDPVGASMSLSSGSMSSSGNDNGSAWCTATSHIGGDPAADLGTPGAANDRC